MCVICVQPAGKYLDKDTAKAMWKTNSDGGGFAYINSDGMIVMEKYMSFKKFWGAFEHHRSDNRDKDFLVHMRIATHGEVNLDNVHPFVVNEHTVMAHNGILHGVDDDPTNKLSDTRMFIKDVLPELPPNWLDSKYLADMVQEWIGWSKLAFLTNDPNLSANIYVLNQSSGDWEKGMWFSNMNHRRTTYKYQGSKVTYNNSTNYKGGANNGQRWNAETRKWEDGPDTDDPFAEAKAIETVPSEDTMIEYASLQEYWDDDNKGRELVLGKGGMSWPETELPWSNTIQPAEKAALTPIWEQLRDTRETCYYPKPIAYDDEFGYWWCYGCDEEVDAGTGTCQCWDKYCVDCTHIAAECECQLGYSNNLTNNVNVFSERSVHDLPQPL